MQGIHILLKLGDSKRESILERVVHNKGVRIIKNFEMTSDVLKYIKAVFLINIEKNTEVCAHFLTVGGEKGSDDAERNPHGFVVRFYEKEGYYGFAGDNKPIFFIHDPLKFSYFRYSKKGIPQPIVKTQI